MTSSTCSPEAVRKETRRRLPYLIIQQGEVVLACLELLAVDSGDEATLLQLRAGVVEGTTCHDFVDVQGTRACYR